MADLSPETLQEIVKLLMPLMRTPPECQALLTLAFGSSSPIFERINLSGAPAVYIPNLVRELAVFGKDKSGKQALWALLEVVHDQVGVDKQKTISELRQEIDALSFLIKEQVQPKPAPSPEETSIIETLPRTEQLEPLIEPQPELLSPEDAARDYVKSMKPIPPENPQFYMAPCFVSNDLYYHFICANKYWHPDEGECKVRGDVDDTYLKHWVKAKPLEEQYNLPVTNISFQAAEAFADWLSQLTNDKIRLPTFEEWQMAVKAGRPYELALAEEVKAGCVNYFTTSGGLRAVDAFDPNPFDIHDLLGNAYDMCITPGDRPSELSLNGGCNYTPVTKLHERIYVNSKKTCQPDPEQREASFRCVRDIMKQRR